MFEAIPHFRFQIPEKAGLKVVSCGGAELAEKSLNAEGCRSTASQVDSQRVAEKRGI
jgi:hypothetical protein